MDVTQVSYLNSGWWDEGTSTSGYVTANASQDVYLESDSIVEKVYVKKGDKVKIGDTLLEYDKNPPAAEAGRRTDQQTDPGTGAAGSKK